MKCCEPGCTAEVLCPVHEALHEAWERVRDRMQEEAEDVGASDGSDRDAVGAYHALRWVMEVLSE